MSSSRQSLPALASLAASALRTLADNTDVAGSSPGRTTADLLAADRSAAVRALRDLATALGYGTTMARHAEAEAQIIAGARAVVATPDAMRRWARAWDAWAAKQAA